jgi:hypothetical protein
MTKNQKCFIIYTSSPESFGFPLAVCKTLTEARKFKVNNYLEIREVNWDGTGLIPEIKEGKLIP